MVLTTMEEGNSTHQ